LVQVAGECGVVLTRIGEVIERGDSALRLRRDGKSIPFASRGFDHFAG
jgi:thiamine monophosphate kinase